MRISHDVTYRKEIIVHKDDEAWYPIKLGWRFEASDPDRKMAPVPYLRPLVPVPSCPLAPFLPLPRWAMKESCSAWFVDPGGGARVGGGVGGAAATPSISMRACAHSRMRPCSWLRLPL